MNQKRRALSVLGILVVLAVVEIVAIFTAKAGASSGPQATILAHGNSTWQQVNSNGFGDPQTGEVSALAAFNGYLYAGTDNRTDGAQILRSTDGMTWTAVTDPGFGIPHDTAPHAILDLEVFNQRLYASTGRSQNAGQIWRSLNGKNWAPMVIAGFADPDTVDITTLAVYNGQIYAGATNRIDGAQIWRSYTGDSNSWTQVASTKPGTDPSIVTAFAEFDGALYAAVESETPAQLWRSYGGDWMTLVADGFGDSNTILTGGMAVFGSYLYVGVGNRVKGAQLWRSNDGEIWKEAIEPGFGDPNNQKVESVVLFGDTLYISVKNVVTGIEIWRSTDGANWEQANTDGFGDSNNTSTNGSNATTGFLDHLYMGTMNGVDGGELWQMSPTFLYALTLSVNDALSGLPGQTVTHTLTLSNTGSMTDTYSLEVADNTWATTLLPPTISLNPGAASPFGVTVSIPADASGKAVDIASITAISKGDETKHATARLTTIVLPVYRVTLSPDDTLSGLPGQTVTYTLSLTNTGNITDAYSLTVTGNSWTTVLSSPSITLTLGANGQFTVAVTIPEDAQSNAFDTGTVTTSSQGNIEIHNTTTLTTKVISLFQKLYLPVVIFAKREVMAKQETIKGVENDSRKILADDAGRSTL
ncbi:MAG: hypothetical protein H3C34_25980 [Caldilineaceae bacterium]|nr:hypothetical protein [Caldilineaceae bacterium]